MRFHQYLFPLAQVGWLLVTLFAIGLSLHGIPTHFAALHQVGTTEEQTRSYLQLSAQDAAALRRIGLQPSFYAELICLLEILFAGTFFVVATLIFLSAHQHTHRRWVALFISLMLVTFGGTVTGFTQTVIESHTLWAGLVAAFQAVETACVLIFFYIFPDGRWVPSWTRYCTGVWLLLNLLWLVFPHILFNPIYAATWYATFGFSSVFMIICIGSGVVAQVWRFQRTADPEQQLQTRYVLFGMIGASIGGTLIYYPPLVLLHHVPFVMLLLYRLGVVPLAFFLVSLVPICLGTSILRRRWWNRDFFNRAALLSMMAGILSFVYCGIVLLIQDLFIRTLGPTANWSVTIIAFLVTVSLFVLGQQYLQPFINWYYKRKRIDTQRLDDIKHKMHDIADLNTLLTALAQWVNEILHVKCTIYLYEQDHFILVNSINSLTKPANFPDLTIDEYNDILINRQVYRPQDKRFALILPLHGLRRKGTTLEGVLVLGPRPGGQPYTRKDRTLLDALAKEGGLAVTAAQYARDYDLLLTHQGAAGKAARLQNAGQQTLLNTYHLARSSQGAVILHTALAHFRTLQDDTLAQLVQGFSLLVTSVTQSEMVEGLRILVVVLETRLAVDWEGVQHAHAFYQACYEALTITEASAFGKTPAIAQPPEQDVTLPASPWQVIWNDFAALAPASHHFFRMVSVTERDDQSLQFHQCRHVLNHIKQHFVDSLLPPEKLVLSCICDYWDHLVQVTFEDLRSQVNLVTTLITQRIHVDGGSILMLDTQNKGAQDVRDLRMQLVSQPDYVILQQPHVLPTLPVGRMHRWEFTIKLTDRTVQTISPTFTLHYVTEQQSYSRDVPSGKVQIMSHSPFHTFDNPYTIAAPLHLDSPVFYGRTKLLTKLNTLMRQPTVILLTGQRRIGKTSLVERLPAYLDRERRLVYIDCQTLIGAPLVSFFWLIAREIADSLQLARPTQELFREEPADIFAHTFLPRIFAMMHAQRLVLVFDEFEELYQPTTNKPLLDLRIFDYLRHLMQHEDRLGFIFVGAHAIDELQMPHWLLLFNVAQHHHVDLLEPEDARALIQDPVTNALDYEDSALDKMLAVTGRHPYFLQILCDQLVKTAIEAQRSWVSLEHVNAALLSVVQMAKVVMLGVWSELSIEEQRIMVGLSHRLPIGRQMRLSEMAAWAREYVECSDEQVERSLAHLMKCHILTVTPIMENEHLEYQWQVWLYSYAVQQHVLSVGFLPR